MSPMGGGPDAREARCVVFDGPGKVRIATRRVPPPGRGQLRVRVAACGVCQRELHVLAGRLPRRFPDVMGHEPVGIVDAAGPDVAGFTVGQWVTGVGQASLSEYDLVEARFTAPLTRRPARPEHWLGEPAMCVVNAANRIQGRPHPFVVVWGVGFMGNLLVQAVRLKLQPQRLIAVDIDDERLALHAHSGAVAALHGRADVAVEVSGASGTIGQATRLLRNGGALALFAHHFAVEPEAVNAWHLQGITVLNTVPWMAPDLGREVCEGVAALERGELRLEGLINRTVPLSDAPAVLREMALGGRAPGKTVILFSPEAYNG